MNENQVICNINDRLNALQKQVYCLAADVANQQIPSIKKQFISGTVINGGKAVIIGPDKRVYPFDITNPYHFDKFVGIAETSASAAMETIVIVIQGISTLIGSGWQPAVPYYIGYDSFLTAVPPADGTGLLKIVGVGVDVNTVLINNDFQIITA